MNVDLAVGYQYRNPGVVRFFKDMLPAVGNNRHKGYHVYLVRDEGTDSLDLVFLFLFGVEKKQLHAGCGGRFLHGAGVAVPPGALRPYLGKTKDKASVPGAFIFSRPPAPGKKHAEHGKAEKAASNDWFHVFSITEPQDKTNILQRAVITHLTKTPIFATVNTD